MSAPARSSPGVAPSLLLSAPQAWLPAPSIPPTNIVMFSDSNIIVKEKEPFCTSNFFFLDESYRKPNLKLA